MRLRFHGAAGEVTGSCLAVECRGRTVLIDCGLIQGGRDAAGRNRAPFPFTASEVAAVLLTHAHLDHSGRLPVLCQRGFSGPIHTHPATVELCAILWRDAAGLLVHEAEVEAQKNGRPVEPLYTEDDAAVALTRFVPVAYGEWRDIMPGLRCRWHDAGHILGAASLELELDEGGVQRRVVISGDLGPYGAPLMRNPDSPAAADRVVMECTYGDRCHRSREATLEELGTILDEAARHGGNVLIPAFAVGRSQELLYHLARHRREWGLARFRIFLDSPLAIQATEIYRRYPLLFEREAAALNDTTRHANPLPELELTESTAASKAINDIAERVIVIAGSGMLTGGRIAHHLRHRLGNPRNHLVITGYQAAGTLGRRLIDGAKTARLYGEEVTVRAKIHTLGGFSAHGDQGDLTRWYRTFDPPPPLYLVHGEPQAAKALSAHLNALHLPEPIIAEREMTISLV